MSRNTIAVVDAGAGNLHSVVRALRYAAPEADIRICQSAEDIRAATRVVLPGQGAFRDCMRQLADAGLVAVVQEAARTKPLLGVCVGLQMLFEHSEEAPDVLGLGILPGGVARFRGPAFEGEPGSALKIPHMGWNRAHFCQEHALWQGIPNSAYFYFVHSYHVQPVHSEHAAATTRYGIHFTCAVATDNIFATQFHPEKSANAGLQIYRNFVHWQP